MSQAAWSFVDYGCGHSTPVRGGNRTIPGACLDCASIPPTEEGTQMTDSIDMERVAELVRRAGYVAYVEQTGGGVATIYASRTADERGYPAAIDADGHHEAIAGPGSFYGERWTLPRGYLNDFYIGPDDDGEAEPYAATPADDEGSLAAKIIATMTGEATYAPRPPYRPCERCGHDAGTHGSFGGYTPSGTFTKGCAGADGCTCSFDQYVARA